jgi:hypothetical protein
MGNSSTHDGVNPPDVDDYLAIMHRLDGLQGDDELLAALDRIDLEPESRYGCAVACCILLNLPSATPLPLDDLLPFDRLLLVKEESMPRDAASAPQLPLFISDSSMAQDVLARYEAIRPVLTGARSLVQQSQQTGMHAILVIIFVTYVAS